MVLVSKLSTHNLGGPTLLMVCRKGSGLLDLTEPAGGGNGPMPGPMGGLPSPKPDLWAGSALLMRLCLLGFVLLHMLFSS